MDDESLDETTINRFTNDPNSQNDFNRLENSDFFYQLNACCSPNEKRYLHDVLFADLKDAEIAELDKNVSQFFDDHHDPATIEQIFGSSLSQLRR